MKSGKNTTQVVAPKDPNVIKGPGATRRNEVVQQMIQFPGGAGKHHTRVRDVEKGQSRKPKHKQNWQEKESTDHEASDHLGNSLVGDPSLAFVWVEDSEGYLIDLKGPFPHSKARNISKMVLEDHLYADTAGTWPASNLEEHLRVGPSSSYFRRLPPKAKELLQQIFAENGSGMAGRVAHRFLEAKAIPKDIREIFTQVCKRNQGTLGLTSPGRIDFDFESRDQAWKSYKEFAALPLPLSGMKLHPIRLNEYEDGWELALTTKVGA